MNSLSSVLSRTVTVLTVAMVAMASITAPPAIAQKAIVYCPVGIDATGCDNTVAALQPIFPGGVDRGYDGSSGTVNLGTADLWSYSVLVIPSLATTSSATPYTVLSDTAMGTRLRNAILGRIVLWSGTPDQGSPNGTAKDTLIQNLARWARANYATVKGPGLVVLQDLSDSVSTRYAWMQRMTGVPVTADSVLTSYAAVQGVTSTGTGMLANPSGLPIGYANMASYGFAAPSPASGFTVDGVGQSGTMQIGQNVLLTSLGGNSGLAVITTDADDYPPGSLVTITGSGFKPGETVTITLGEIPKLDTHPNVVVVADGTGGFSDRSFSPDSADLNVRFIATATGTTSGVRAVTTFTDAIGINNNAATLGAQSPAPVIIGSNATFLVSVAFNGSGGTCTVGLSVTSALPSGASASFSPATLTNSNNTTLTSTLTIATTAATPAGSTPLSVRALGTGGTGNSCTTANSASTTSGTLVVSAPIIVTANATITSSAASSVFNQSVTFTATVSPSTATGTMQFRDGATNLGSPVAIAGGTASVSTSTLSVGSHTISAVYTPGSGFAAGTVTSVTQTVGKAAATVTLGSLAPTYTGSPLSATATTTPAGLTVGFTYDGSATAPTNAGSYAVVGTVNDPNYAGSASGTLIIAKASQGALSLSGNPASAAYGSSFTVTPAGGSGTGAFTVTATGACSNTGNSVTMTSGTGTCAITLDRAGDTNHLAATQISASVTATRATVTPAVSAQNKPYDGTATATASGSVSPLVGGDVVTLGIANAAFVDKNVGTGKTVTASGLTLGGAQAGNYLLSSTTATTTANITPRALTVSAAGVNRPYDGTTSATVTLSDDRVSGDALTIAYTSASFADSHVGTNKTVSVSGITVTGGDAGNYTFNASATTTANITPAPLTITASSPADIQYGAAAPAVTSTPTGLVGGDAASVVTGLTCGTSYTQGSPVGTYATTCSGGSAADYTLGYVAGSFHVTPAALSISVADQTRGYGDPNPPLTGTVTGIQNSDNITVSYSTAATPASDVGSYPITATIADPTNRIGNYTVTNTAGHLVITPAPLSVTANDHTRIYGGTDPVFDGTLTGIKNSDAITATYATTALANSGVGSYPITPTLVDPNHRLPNYSVTSTNGHLDITPAPLSITAQSASRLYGGADPAFGADYVGFVLGETPAALGGTLAISTTATSASDVGTYPITPSGFTSSNYTITYHDGTLTVNPAPLTIAAASASRLYGDPDPALTGTITGIMNGDAITATYSTTATAATGIGGYPIVPAAVATAPAKLTNYAVTLTNGTLTITPAPLTVATNAQTKIYGAANPTLTGTVTGIKNSDDITATYATAADATTGVGSYPITATLSDPGSKLANYSVTNAGNTLTITPAPLTIAAASTSKIYGDANPALTGTISGIQNGDGITATYTTPATVGSIVGAYAIVPAAVDATPAKLGNYTVTLTNGTLTVTQAPLTVTTNARTKVQGDMNPPLTGSVTGIKNSDNITASYTTTAVVLSPPGTYPITATLVDPNGKLPNYSVSNPGALLTVTPNAPPVLGAVTGPTDPAKIGTAIAVSATFTDVDVSASTPYATVINWGDGQTTTGTAAAPGTISGSHPYAAAGVYTVTITVSDKINTTPVAQTFEYVVVYDPSAGFVTGGGWINSPAGACQLSTACTGAVGKANFGFNAAYKKGQTIPDGNTEFQFQAGGLNFKSVSYQWLVVSGSKAQFKGTGTINGQGSYTFILTAADGDLKGGSSVDSFRIKITGSGGIVYDNQMNSPDDITGSGTTALGGGSIVIH